MSNVVRPPFVHCVPMPEGSGSRSSAPETMIARTFPPKPGERWPDAVRRFFESRRCSRRSDLRANSRRLGLDEAAVSTQIERARKQNE